LRALLFYPFSFFVAGAVQSHILNRVSTCMNNKYPAEFQVGGDMLTKDELKRTAPRVTVPEPEMTKDKKYKCPIDQQVYDNKEDYAAHCKEEHDVL